MVSRPRFSRSAFGRRSFRRFPTFRRRSFRTFGRRSLFVDYKQGTLSIFHEAFGNEWAARMGQIMRRPLSDNPTEDLALNYDQLTPAELRQIVTRYGITHIILRSGRTDLPYRQVYANAYFRILATAGPLPLP